MRGPDAFWREWLARSGDQRDLGRTGRLIEALDLRVPDRPVVEVVGSKGKGTTATYVSAYLASAGLDVVTVTSPELRHAGDRIRLNGRSASEATLEDLTARIDEARASLPEYRPGSGYLSPGGLFIVAGVLYAHLVGADVLVLEAGMGGVSDEISLFSPGVLAVATIFGEHLGKLGDTTVEIAAEKAGVATPDTRSVVSLSQTQEVASALAATVRERTGGRTGVETVRLGSSGVPGASLPPGLGRANAELGCAAGRALLEAMGARPPSPERLRAVLGSVRLPGRSSWHDLPGGRARVFLDAAISRAGVAAALAEAYRRWSGIDHVLVCMPDHKDVEGAIAELAGLRVTFVRLDFARLRFEHPLPPDWEVVDAADVDAAFVEARGPRVAALGTGYFVREMLELLDADTTTLFTAGPS